MGIRMDKSLSEMSLAALTQCCTQELAKYRRKEPSNDIYCLEIFRRAVMQRDNEAWTILRALFSESVKLWIARHPYREAALRHEPENNYIDDTFRRFWQAVSDQQLAFSTLSGALSYLHLCLNCAIMDTLRASLAPEETLPFSGDYWVKKLAAMHPDDLSPTERAELGAHVSTCWFCTALT